VSTSFDPNDELCRLWQTLDRPLSDKEVNKIMELVETRAKTFERNVYWRNIREYIGAALATIIFGVLAYNASTLYMRVAFGTISAAGLWVILFLWLMHRSAPALLPELSSETYKRQLLATYDRQIMLTRTAWAWYVFPFTAGLLLVHFGNTHSPAPLTFGIAGFTLLVGVGIAVLNFRAAKAIDAEKRDLEVLLRETEQ
jgi:hypothetical protein